MTGRKLFFRTVIPHLSTAVLILLCGLPQPTWGQVTFQTRYTVVMAQTEADFLEMERRLHFRPSVPINSTPQANGKFAFHPAFPRLAAKIDAILDRTSHLLKIQPLRPSRLHIILLENGKEVRQRRLALIPGQRQSLFGFASLEAFYEASSLTIYLSLEDLHEGILAHEMAHYLLCSAVSPHPPSKVQETWAHYVESRL